MTQQRAQGRYSHWWLDRCFLYVGRMAPSKGVAEIIAAWLALEKRIGESCPPLWLVGGEPDEIERIRNKIYEPAFRQFEMSGKIRWWGYLDEAGIAAVLLKAYVLITHSLYEPGGRVILEAMAQGIPVIATPHGFALDLIEDWHGGFLVGHGNVGVLARRMEHFAQQPLLRHAMGAVARRSAWSALDDWKFMETHMRLYQVATQNSGHISLATLTTGRRPDRAGARRPPPRGFGSVYPFEGDLVDLSHVREFVSRAIGAKPDKLVEQASQSGRSRLWKVRHGERVWMVKHAQSTYAVRPIWDRGFLGPIAESQGHRVSGEITGASCSGAAPIIASDRSHGLILRQWMDLAGAGALRHNTFLETLNAFHLSRPTDLDVGLIREHLDRDWRDVSAEELVRRLSTIDGLFRESGRSFHAWQPMSLRIGWRWLKLGLINGWLELPDGVRQSLDSRIDEESDVAAKEESTASFGWSHGDVVPDHFRTDDSGSVVMIDCERIHPGFFGHDPSRYALGWIDRCDDVEASIGSVKAILDEIPASLCSRRLVWSWFLWVTAIDTCRSHGLMDEEKMARDLWRLRILSHYEAVQGGPPVSP